MLLSKLTPVAAKPLTRPKEALPMRQYWRLPEESKMTYTGQDWFLILLASLDADQKQNFLLLLWSLVPAE
jgi:hypothetical protein